MPVRFRRDISRKGRAREGTLEGLASLIIGRQAWEMYTFGMQMLPALPLCDHVRRSQRLKQQVPWLTRPCQYSVYTDSMWSALQRAVFTHGLLSVSP